MPLAPDIVAGISRRLVEHAGLELPAWVVEARSLVRIAALGITPDAYVELIGMGRGAAELRELVEAVRVGESSLFRHRSQIAALIDVVVPALRERGRRTVRVWSAGCASGEEPYTLAIILSRALPGHTISIVATDVSDDALEAAQRATFPSAELADVPDEYRDAVIDDGEHVRVRPEIAQLVRFERANLVDAPPPRHCDVVWCRNVLIYFSVAARRRAIERLVAATVPGGFVFVGYSESLREVTELDAQRAGDAVFYVKRGDWNTDRTPVPELLPREQTSPGLAIASRTKREGTDPGIAVPRAESTPAPTRTTTHPADAFAAARTGTKVGVAPTPALNGFLEARTEVGVAPLRAATAPAPAVPRTGTRAGVVPAASAADVHSRRTPVGGVPAVVIAIRPIAGARDASAHRATAAVVDRNDKPTPAGGVPAVHPFVQRKPAASASDPRTPRTSPGVPVIEPVLRGPAATPPPVARPQAAYAASSTDADARRTPPGGVPRLDPRAASAEGAAVDHARRTPPAGVPVFVASPEETILVLTGAPDAKEVTDLLGERLAIVGLQRLTIDLDSAVMLEDELAPVIRRACAAARGAGVEIVILATRTGAKRWVSRHALEEVST